jgi:pimeloyl-ACP methyl ester carboxylesterase
MKTYAAFSAAFLLVFQAFGQKTVTNESYELRIPADPKAVLVLFPGFPETVDRVKVEAADILREADNHRIAVVLMGFNQHVSLKNEEKIQLSAQLGDVLAENRLNRLPLTIGGFSGGGNVALLLASHLMETQTNLPLKGVFAIDAPVDLQRLYENAQYYVKRNHFEGMAAESRFLIDMFNKTWGPPSDSLHNYIEASPYLYASHTTQNLAALKPLKVRLYTELALDWQWIARRRTYEEINGFQNEHLCLDLKKSGFKNVECIITENKGYRANGDRNPHSWSIADGKNLANWMLE